MSDENEIIPGIFNYCDRWCQRCPMTHRCLLALQEAVDEATSAGERDNESFWEEIQRKFTEVREMVKREFEARGLTIEEVEPDPEGAEAEAREERRRERRIENHPCAKASMAYATRSGEFLRDENVEGAFASHGWPIEKLRGESLEVGADEDFERIWNAVQVIAWYQYQIAVKLQRAIDGIDDEDDEEIQALPDYIRDSDGSAKVALIGIDRSLAAWGEVREMLPELGEEVFDMMLELDGVRRCAEAVFPNARAVRRRGFEK